MLKQIHGGVHMLEIFLPMFRINCVREDQRKLHFIYKAAHHLGVMVHSVNTSCMVD